MKIDWEESLGACQDPDDDGLQLLARLEQKPALYCPTGHLDQSSPSGDESQSPSHNSKDALHTLDLADSAGT